MLFRSKSLKLSIAVLVLMATSFPALALENGRATRNINIQTGTWAMQALGQNQSPTNTAYTITWAVNRGTAYSYFVFRNTGSFSVSGFQVSITQVQVGGSGKPPDTTFDWCSNGTWDATTNLCSGTIVFIGSSADLLLAFTGIALTSGSDLSMRATTKPNLQNAFTTTISPSVNRSNVRAGWIVNS